MKGGLLLDVVVGKSAAILELLSGEDETLLIRGDTGRDKARTRISISFLPGSTLQ